MKMKLRNNENNWGNCFFVTIVNESNEQKIQIKRNNGYKLPLYSE